MGRRTIDIDIVIPRRRTGDTFEESKHPRQGGKFASSAGSSASSPHAHLPPHEILDKIHNGEIPHEEGMAALKESMAKHAPAGYSGPDKSGMESSKGSPSKTGFRKAARKTVR